MAYSERDTLRQLNALIEENFNNPNFSTNDICRELALSRSHLFRLVKEATQLSISLYIRQRKILKAKELLDHSNLKISEITYQVGIDSPQSFSKYFAQEFGISPTEYRKTAMHVENNNAKEDEHPIQFQENKNTDSSWESADVEVVLKRQKQPFFKPSKKILWVVTSLTMFIILALFFYFKLIRTEAQKVATSITENSIAILPFKNLGAPETVFFTEGVVEQVRSSLAHIENLKVISNTSSILFKDSKKTIPQIADELNVHYILVGTVLQFDKKVRVSAELIKGMQDKIVWTKSYDGREEDVIPFMNKVAQEIAAVLHQKMNNELSLKLARVPTENVKAYNEYLQGKQLVLARSKEKMEASIVKFDAAIAIDPHFADAYAQKANAYFLLGDNDYMELKTSLHMTEQNVLTAIRLDAENGFAYAVLANTYRRLNKWEQAITTYQIALKHSPNDAQILYWYSISLRSIGQLDEAIKYSTKAIALNPLHPVIFIGHIGNYAYAHKFDLALKVMKDGELYFKGTDLYYWGTAFYYINLGDYAHALKDFKTAEQLSPNVPAVSYMIAYTQAKLGQTEQAKTYLQSLSQTPDNYRGFAIIYAGLGDKEQCLKYLEMGVEQGMLPDYLKVSPLFKFLHNDKRFENILQKVGLLNPSFNTKIK